MHTTEWEGIAYPEQRPKTPGPTIGARPAKVTMHHDGDYGGNVAFILPQWIADVSTHHHADPVGGGSMAEVHIPFAAILKLANEYYRSRMISTLENADDEQLTDFIARDLQTPGVMWRPTPREPKGRSLGPEQHEQDKRS